MTRGIIQDVILDTSGNALVGIPITIKVAGSITNATLYDAVTAGNVLDNPILSGALGYFFAYADTGEYDLEIDSPGGMVYRPNVSCFDADDISGVAVSAAAAASSADASAVSAAAAAASVSGVTLPVGTLAELLAVNAVAGDLIDVKGRLTLGDGYGGRFLVSATDYSSEVAADTVSAIYLLLDNGLYAVRIYEGKKQSKWFGVKSDGTLESADSISALRTTTGDVLLQKGICLFAPPFSVASNTNLFFEEGAVLKANNTSSHVLGGVSEAENITVHQPVVDGDNIRGLNGFGFSSLTSTPSKNITLYNPVAKNCKRSATTGGGRGVAIQDGVTGIAVIAPRVYDCTSGYDLNGGFSGIDPVLAVFISDAYAENCEEALSVYSDASNSNATVPPTQPDSIQALITSLTARNCGKSADVDLYSGSGTASDKDGGVIVSRRGRNIRINKLSVFNDSTYTIGALFRGTGNNIQIDDFEMWGNCDAVAVIGSADNLLPLANSDDASYGIRAKGSFHGTASNLVDVRISTGTNFITSCHFDFEVDGFVASNSILTTLSSFRSDSTIRVKDTLNGRETIGSLLDVVTSRNTLALAVKTFNFASNVGLAGALSVDGTSLFSSNATFNGNITMGSSGRVDYSATSGGAGSAEGYVLVQVGGVTKKIPYHAS